MNTQVYNYEPLRLNRMRLALRIVLPCSGTFMGGIRSNLRPAKQQGRPSGGPEKWGRWCIRTHRARNIASSVRRPFCSGVHDRDKPSATPIELISMSEYSKPR